MPQTRQEIDRVRPEKPRRAKGRKGRFPPPVKKGRKRKMAELPRAEARLGYASTDGEERFLCLSQINAVLVEILP